MRVQIIWVGQKMSGVKKKCGPKMFGGQRFLGVNNLSRGASYRVSQNVGGPKMLRGQTNLGQHLFSQKKLEKKGFCTPFQNFYPKSTIIGCEIIVN